MSLVLGFISLFSGIIMCAIWLAMLLNDEPGWGWALAIDILLFAITFLGLGG